MQVNLSLVAAMRQVFLRALPLPAVNITIPPTLHTQTSPLTLGRTNGRSLGTLRKKQCSFGNGGSAGWKCTFTQSERTKEQQRIQQVMTGRRLTTLLTAHSSTCQPFLYSAHSCAKHISHDYAIPHLTTDTTYVIGLTNHMQRTCGLGASRQCCHMFTTHSCRRLPNQTTSMYKTNRTYITKEQTPYRVQTGFRLSCRAGQFYTLGSLQAMLAALSTLLLH